MTQAAELLSLETVKVQKWYVHGCQASAAGYAKYMDHWWSEQPPEQVAAFAMEKLEEARQKDIEAHERNLRRGRTDDGFAYATATYERLKAEYAEYAERAKLEAEQERTGQ